MTTTGPKTTKKTTKKVTKKGSSESVKAQKMKSKPSEPKQIPAAALAMVRKETSIAIRDRLYSAQMVGAVARNHGLDRAGSESAIREVCDPIIEQLEK